MLRPILLAAFGSLVSAGFINHNKLFDRQSCNQDDCLRDLEHNSVAATSDCSVFLGTVTVTSTSAAVTATATSTSTITVPSTTSITSQVTHTKTDVIKTTSTSITTSTIIATSTTTAAAKRAVAAHEPLRYAPMCSGDARFSSACSCIGVKPKTSTVIVPIASLTTTSVTTQTSTATMTKVIATSTTTLTIQQTSTYTVTSTSKTTSTTTVTVQAAATPYFFIYAGPNTATSKYALKKIDPNGSTVRLDMDAKRPYSPDLYFEPSDSSIRRKSDGAPLVIENSADGEVSTVTFSFGAEYTRNERFACRSGTVSCTVGGKIGGWYVDIGSNELNFAVGINGVMAAKAEPARYGSVSMVTGGS